MSTYQGIDYGLGRSNVDSETGIRYGVISQHSVGQAWYDEAQPEYGEATCPKCGSEAIVETSELTDDQLDAYSEDHNRCADWACHSCEYIFASDDAYPEDPQGWTVDDGEYQLTDCLDSDIMVIKSPYYTFAQFCSPCVPGACSLDSPIEGGAVKAYALGHEWFEDNAAPYVVYRVSDDSIVDPE